uniref:Uncharacterized protein n=1 Tax=Oryza rufipogon TaxID=4529 RepID=A0A0E0N6H0_ORYRU
MMPSMPPSTSSSAPSASPGSSATVAGRRYPWTRRTGSSPPDSAPASASSSLAIPCWGWGTGQRRGGRTLRGGGEPESEWGHLVVVGAGEVAVDREGPKRRARRRGRAPSGDGVGDRRGSRRRRRRRGHHLIRLPLPLPLPLIRRLSHGPRPCASPPPPRRS